MDARDRAFEEFHEAICLTQTQRDRLDSAQRGVSTTLIRELGVAEDAIRLQGSYATGTTIRPLDGDEFDIDLVIRDCARDGESSTTALQRVLRAIERNEVYKNKAELRNPCVRIAYADSTVGKMHVDVVPLRTSTEPPEFSDAPHQVHGWHATAPGSFAEWVGQQPMHYCRTLRMLKSWRDEAEGVRDSVSSIILQVLIARSFVGGSDDAERIAATLKAMRAVLPDDEVPRVENPVLQSEDLARNWKLPDYRLFLSMLEEACDMATSALGASSWPEEADHWQDLFGSRFPLPSREAVGVELADYSHQSSFASRGWRVALDPGVSVGITAERASRSGGRRRPLSARFVVASGQHLWFTAHVSGSSSHHVWWRVTNTGEHATQEQSLRGQIIAAKNANGELSSDLVHYEATAYTGVHLVEAIAVADDTVVAKSEPFEVSIVSSNWDPRRRRSTYPHHGMH